jgi:CheY-like chemotaxis protein
LSTNSSTAAKTILICEDEDALRELIRVSLGPGYRFVEAVDGVESLELARELRPDLVVLDLMLPRKTGVEVLEDLRNDRCMRDTPVVVITAWTHAQQAAVAAGADRFVAKPFDPDDLRTVVRELLQRR